MTGYMFDLVRCKCQSAEDIAYGPTTEKFYNLEQAHLQKTFAHIDPERQVATAENAGFFENGAIIADTYKVIKLIGQGGMGIVYLTMHLSLQKQCALKMIPPHLVTNESWGRFQQEARSIAKIDHINLVKVTDLGIHKGYMPFYAMEYVTGKNLSDILVQRVSLPLATAIKIFTQVCDGLDHAHRAGIAHRDLKPANIMIVGSVDDEKPLIKILDFGLAKLTGASSRDKQSLTVVGDIFGSPYYMSPEQCSSHKIDNRTDIYSIGCTLFEVLTGRPPFLGDTAAELGALHVQAEAPSLESVSGKGAFPDGMEIIMAKLLRKNPVERYQTFKELRSDLYKLSTGEKIQPYYVARTITDSIALANASATESEEGQSFTKSKSFVPVVPYAICLAVLAFVCSPFIIGLVNPHSNSLDLPKLDKHHLESSQGVKSIGDDGFDTLDMFYSGKKVRKVSIPVKTPDSAALTTPYSKIIETPGGKVICFDFPTDVSIGSIRPTLIDTPESIREALGSLKFPYPNKFYFLPTDATAIYPNYLKRFKPNEIAGVDFTYVANPNVLLSALQQMPGYEHIRFLGLDGNHVSGEIDENSWKILDSFRDLTGFVCRSDGIRVAHIDRFSWFKNLTALTMSTYCDISAILLRLKELGRLKILCLNRCSLNKDDLQTIAAMPSLIDMRSISTISSLSQLLVLSRAPRLEKLTIDAQFAMDMSLPVVLRNFRHLKNLTFDRANPAQVERIRSIKLPGVAVTFTPAD